ncbi:hypothetical protein [Laceyella putida]|uniref:MarR family transcriptional regulator n=1 Tax=Laceyella putida TaxID=110101 RepID=A0ABW2RQX3_9BACL
MDQKRETIVEMDKEIAKIYTASCKVARSLKKAGFKPVKESMEGWWFLINIKELCDNEEVTS